MSLLELPLPPGPLRHHRVRRHRRAEATGADRIRSDARWLPRHTYRPVRRSTTCATLSAAPLEVGSFTLVGRSRHGVPGLRGPVRRRPAGCRRGKCGAVRCDQWTQSRVASSTASKITPHSIFRCMSVVLVEAVDGLAQSIAVAVGDRSNRGPGADLVEVLDVADRRVIGWHTRPSGGCLWPSGPSQGCLRIGVSTRRRPVW